MEINHVFKVAECPTKLWGPGMMIMPLEAPFVFASCLTTY